MAAPQPPSATPFGKIRRWLELHPYGALTLAVLAALGPFLTKPFNIDDPLFIWAAHQIQAHPADPYGFNVEWGWRSFPMWKVTENPPLACYYLAGAAGILGWSEWALHFAFLFPAIAVVLGTYRLACHFCLQPALAALATLCMPFFLVSSLTVMCDVTMLAFWVWASVFWLEGTAQNNSWKLFAAGSLMALAAMTKYYGACLIPLLAAYSLVSRRQLQHWGQFLLIPLATLWAYQWVTQAIYGDSLLYRAMDYASFSKGLFNFSQLHSCLTALAFTGGGLAVAGFFAPLLWRPRVLLAYTAGAGLILAILVSVGVTWERYGIAKGAPRLGAGIQFAFWVAVGLSVLALTVVDVASRRDAKACLLAFWILGTFAFTAFCNWTVNARSILPMAPAVAILILRRLDQTGLKDRKTWPPKVIICLAASALLSLSVTSSDFLVATAARRCADEIGTRFNPETDRVWFQGHWGFQYYMQSFGVSALDFKRSDLKAGDLVVVPSNNTNVLPPSPKTAELLEVRKVDGPRWLTTWNQATGAGFYSATMGPLPFAFGRVPPESVSLYILRPPAPPPAPEAK